MLKKGHNPHRGGENEESVREKGGKSHGWHNLSECVLKIGQTEHEKHKNGENVLEKHKYGRSVLKKGEIEHGEQRGLRKE